jgi:HEAT repeat protein
VRQAAIQVLAELRSAQAVDPLLSLLQDGDPEMHKSAA